VIGENIVGNERNGPEGEETENNRRKAAYGKGQDKASEGTKVNGEKAGTRWGEKKVSSWKKHKEKKRLWGLKGFEGSPTVGEKKATQLKWVQHWTRKTRQNRRAPSEKKRRKKQKGLFERRARTEMISQDTK